MGEQRDGYTAPEKPSIPLTKNEEPLTPTTPRQKVAPPPSKPKKKKKKELQKKVRGHSVFPFTWPLILFGFICPWLNSQIGMNATSWAWLGTGLVVALTTITDWNFRTSVKVLAMAAFMTVLILLCREWKIWIFSDIYHWFEKMEMGDVKNLSLVTGIICAVLILIHEPKSYLKVLICRPNIIILKHFMGARIPITEGREVPRPSFPDLWEFILIPGTGSITIKTNDGGTYEEKRVWFLWFRQKGILATCEREHVTQHHH